MGQSKARYVARQMERREAESQYLPSVPALDQDTLWRGLSREGEFRVLVARLTSSLREIGDTLGANADTLKLLAELAVGGLLVRSTLDPDSQMQLTVRNPGAAGRLYLDAWPSGQGYRASLQNPDARETSEQPLFRGGEFDLVRSRKGGTPHRSARLLGEEDLAQAYMAHLLESDQIRAILSLDVRVRDGQLEQACGYLVQVTPEGGRGDIEKLLENVEGLPDLGPCMTATDPDARGFCDRLLDGYRWDQAAREEVLFVCRCSRERLVAILRQLPEDEVRSMVEEDETIETTCEFCRARFDIEPRELQ